LSFVGTRSIVACLVALAFVPVAHAGVPRVDARAYLVEDATTGAVLAQHNATERVPIASLTKLMTILIALQSGVHVNDVVTVQRAAAQVGESTIHLRAGERITAGDLLRGALIQSANDAADALADYVADGNQPKFVGMMNAEARRLRLTGTHFARPDGLDAPHHYSGARDVTKLAQIAMKYPLVRAIVRERTATIEGGERLHTWNDLLGVFRGLDGVKTGHTAGAGWCEVAHVQRDGLDVYATVLGSPTRSQRNIDLAALLRWAFSVERRAWVIPPAHVYLRAPSGYGRGAIPLVAAEGVVRPVRIDRTLVERVTAPDVVSLPVHRGEQLGEVRIFSGRRLVARQPLVAARSASAPGMAGRVGFYFRHTFSHIGAWL
jgi:serine-type D-Ala-D-Ala carboxypeptidase (penicillin-binding protein 5/6)